MPKFYLLHVSLWSHVHDNVQLFCVCWYFPRIKQFIPTSNGNTTFGYIVYINIKVIARIDQDLYQTKHILNRNVSNVKCTSWRVDLIQFYTVKVHVWWHQISRKLETSFFLYASMVKKLYDHGTLAFVTRHEIFGPAAFTSFFRNRDETKIIKLSK
jgi:hypothetical protein